MKLLIVLNSGLSLESFFGDENTLKLTASMLDIEITIKYNSEIEYYYSESGIKINLPKFDAVLFYSKDINLANAMEKNGYKLFNSSNTIAICDNKAETYKILAENKIKIPKTYILPLAFFYEKNQLNQFVTTIVKNLGFPMIAKKWYGSRGEQVFLIKNELELKNLIEKENGKELLFQQFFTECFGTDLRINIINGKVISSIKRISTNGDFRSNLSIGSTAEKYTLTDEEKNIALKSADVLGCDFCGVDILQTNGGAVVCEVNSNAQMRFTSKFSGINIPKCIFEYIISAIK